MITRINYVLKKNQSSHSPRVPEQWRHLHHSSGFAASGQQIPPPHPRLPELPQSGNIGAVFGLVVAPCEQLGETESVRKRWWRREFATLFCCIHIYLSQFPEETVWLFQSKLSPCRDHPFKNKKQSPQDILILLNTVQGFSLRVENIPCLWSSWLLHPPNQPRSLHRLHGYCAAERESCLYPRQAGFCRVQTTQTANHEFQ